MLFCNADGEMIPSRHVDLISFGDVLKAQGLDVPQNLSDNLANIFECFGEIQTDERIIQVIKEEKEPKVKGKEAPLKKVGDPSDQPKPVDVLQKMTSFEEFEMALHKIKSYDRMISRMGLIKSSTLDGEVHQIIADEERNITRILSKLNVPKLSSVYEHHVKEVQSFDVLPEAPKEA